MSYQTFTSLVAHFGVGGWIVFVGTHVPVLAVAPFFWVVAALVVGLGKELYDWQHGGLFDWRDLVVTVGGGGLAYALAKFFH